MEVPEVQRKYPALNRLKAQRKLCTPGWDNDDTRRKLLKPWSISRQPSGGLWDVLSSQQLLFAHLWDGDVSVTSASSGALFYVTLTPKWNNTQFLRKRDDMRQFAATFSQANFLNVAPSIARQSDDPRFPRPNNISHLNSPLSDLSSSLLLLE